MSVKSASSAKGLRMVSEEDIRAIFQIVPAPRRVRDGVREC
jgi:hypothetical protein